MNFRPNEELYRLEKFIPFSQTFFDGKIHVVYKAGLTDAGYSAIQNHDGSSLISETP